MNDAEILNDLMKMIIENESLNFIKEKTYKLAQELRHLNKNQINSLRAVFDKAENFRALKKETSLWLKHQENKEKSGWRSIVKRLENEIFNWDQDKTKYFNNVLIRIFQRNNILRKEMENLIFDIDNNESLEIIRYCYARKFFYTLISFYKCFNSNDMEIVKKLEGTME